MLNRPHFRYRMAAQWLVALLVVCVIFPAAADDGKPRFVSGAGRDQGDCQNRFRPCRTLSYAIAHAGKGDGIQVAEGTYSVRNSQELYDLLAANARLAGGFTQLSGYSERTAKPSTVLVGVPPEFRDRFEAAGFTVIVDTKGLGVSSEETQSMEKVAAEFTALDQSHPLTPCVGGQASVFPCQSVSLFAHLSLPELEPVSTAGNDVWGFKDLNTGREYAFMGLRNGVAVVDVTNPEAPEQVGTATGSATTWRDIKVYQLYDAAAGRWRAYAYASADNVTDFLMVLDLSDLPNGIERVNFSSDFRAAHNAYLVNADYTYGLALSNDVPQLGIAGGNTAGGNHRLYSLADPRAPQLLSVSAAGYAHDLASVPIGDARKNSQCVNAQAAARCQVLSDFNENTVDVWDITNPSAPQLLSSQQYTNFGYVHSGWWTEDGRYLLVHDELDERDHGLNTTVRVFDLANLLAPVLAGSWVGPTRAIDHNGYVKGNRYYVSNYSEGLTVLDLTDPTAPTRVGYFDTFAGSSVTNFVGAWGVYPFFASGTIAVGDINSGLYLLRNETLGSAAGSFAIANAALAGTEGETLSVTVNRSAGAGAVSVDLEMLAATATAADATLAATTLNWAAGETQPKTAALTLTGDAVSEGLELLLLRLKSPRGGATIAYPDTTAVSIAEPGATTRIRLLDYALAIDDARGKALVTVTRHGSAGGEARVSFRTLTGGTHGGVTPAQGELVWANGEAGGKVASVELNPATLGGGQSATIQMEFSNAVNASLEAADGSPVLVVPLTVTVSDSGSPSAPPPSAPPPPSGSGGGGGTFSLLALLVLGALLARRRRFV